MTKEEFRHIVHEQPKKISDKELSHLENLITNFPYCQVAHILVAKAYKDNDNMLSSKKIRTAAVYSANRRRLKHFIQQHPKNDAPAESVTQTPVSAREAVPETPPPSQHKTERPTTNTSAHTAKEPVTKAPEKKNIASELEATLAQLRSSKKAAFEHLSKDEREKESLKQQETNEKEPLQKQEEKEEPIAPALQSEDKREKKEPIKYDVSITGQEFSAASSHEVKDKSATLQKKKTSKQTEKKESKGSSKKATVKKTTPKQAKEKAPKKTPSKKQASDKKKAKDHVPSSPQKVQSTRTGEVIDRGEEMPADTLLHYLEHTKARRNKTKKKDQIAIIDEFIKKDPSIKRNSPKEAKAPQKDLSAPATKLKTNIVTENMAKINLRQGNQKRAKEIYNELMLKYPEKKSYFASQIEKINK